MNENALHLSSRNREELRLEVMRLVEANPEMSQRAIARELGVSLGGVNYAMRALVERGLIKVRNFGRSDKKCRCAYVLTSAGVKQKSELTSAFLSRKLEEYEVLRQEIEVLRLEVGENEGAG